MTTNNPDSTDNVLVLDNSAFSLLYCDRRFQNTVITGLRGASSPNALFGNALHTAVEVLDKTGDVNKAIEAVITKGYSCDEIKLIEVLTNIKLTQRFPPPIAIEVKFKFHYKFFPTPFGPLDIYLAGTIDRIHITDDGWLEFIDWKSAQDFKEASQRGKIEEYENSFQLPFYVFAAHHAEFLPPEAMELLKQRRYRTKFIFAFYTSVPSRIITKEFPAYPEGFFESRFQSTLSSYIHRAVSIWVQTKHDAIAAYSGMNVYKGCTYCPYRLGCLTFDAQKEAQFLERFERKPYNPLQFR